MAMIRLAWVLLVAAASWPMLHATGASTSSSVRGARKLLWSRNIEPMTTGAVLGGAVIDSFIDTTTADVSVNCLIGGS